MRRYGGLLLAAQLFVLGCAAAPTPLAPYRLRFALSGPTLRLLRTSEETTVPLTVRNSGEAAWDPARVHVSYHWLWFVPRELLKRSRTVPYHDGIRTELASSVPPGGEVNVHGRVLAPSFPGLYWLQWDMVEEGVTWFAQVSPRQPRALVVVLPTAAGFFSPLPLLVAIVGLGLSRRSRAKTLRSPAKADGADLLWCSAVLLVKPLILAREALLEPTAVAYWLIVAVAITVPLVCFIILPRRVRAWVVLGLGTFATLLMLGDALYYRFFGDVLSASAMLAARQAGQLWGTIRSLLDPAMLWLVVDVPFMAWLVVTVTHTKNDSRPLFSRTLALGALVIIAAAAIVPAVRVIRTGGLDQTFRDRAVMEQLGPLGYHTYDAWRYAQSRLFRPPVTEQQIAEARRWFVDRAPLRAGTGPLFGAAAGRNLIVLQVESLQDFLVDYRVNGKEVMPHLHGWQRETLRFTNVTDQTSEGRTSDAELTAMASLLPLDRGAAAFRFAGNRYVGLPSVLAEHGYATLSAVPFEAGFWNRRVMHPSYGFARSLFEPDFVLTEQIGWGLNDRDFLQQMAPRLAELPQPFLAWLITLSLHHPYDSFPDAHKELALGPLEGTPFGNYLHTMHFFDSALDAFLSSLGRRGLLDRTMIAVFGDHDAGFARDDALAATMRVEAGRAAWELNDRVPFFVKIPDAGGGVFARIVPLAAGQTDFAPTLLALLGIDPAPLPYMGRNLLGEPGDAPIVRPYGEWLDRTHLYLSSGQGEGECYAVPGATRLAPAACREADAAARRARDVSRLVIADDLQQRLREALR